MTSASLGDEGAGKVGTSSVQTQNQTPCGLRCGVDMGTEVERFLVRLENLGTGCPVTDTRGEWLSSPR